MKESLTGKWFIKKRWFGCRVMVQIMITIDAPLVDQPGEQLLYRKAKPADIIELGIPCA